MTTTPILRIVDPYKNLIVFIDTSKDGLGGFLTQYGHVICYESRKLKDHEKNYASHDMELETSTHDLKIWSHYLVRKFFIVVNSQYWIKMRI